MTKFFVLAIVALIAMIKVTSAKVPYVPLVCPTREDSLSKATYLADPFDCASFYECANGVPVHLHCPSDLVYDIQKQTCNYLKNVRCGWRVIVKAENVDEDTLLTSNQEEVNFDIPEISVCPTRDVGHPTFLADYHNCAAYFECSNGTPVHMYCPAGLVYDIQKTTCNYLANVRCGWRPYPQPYAQEKSA
ncbi:hypothetical protein ABEB36_012203 [Hypothenemus hampei]|uniref:Chitin-binding type-2 domain-containing protein n=1 Tax=Hypothenemus hampei TaxID=57062 RepID=A0ABD1EAD9_HYPHA